MLMLPPPPLCTHCICAKILDFCTVANAQLRGNNDKDAALIQQFVNFADNEILPAAATWVFPTYGIIQYNKQVLSSSPIVVFIL